MKKFIDPVVENSSVVFMMMDLTGKNIVMANLAARKLLAQGPLFSDKEFSLGEHLEEVYLLKQGRPMLSKTIKLGNTPYRLLYRLEGRYVILEALDATDARHDWLTKLPNKGYFDEELGSAVARATRQKSDIAVFLMDLNGFKKVNDEHGHVVGDELLVEVARRLGKVTRGGDIIARLGGDEFAAIVFNSEKGAAEKFAERITEAFNGPILIGDNEFPVGIAIGIAQGPLGGESSGNLLHRADLAMYRSKKSGKPVFCAHKSS